MRFLMWFSFHQIDWDLICSSAAMNDFSEFISYFGLMDILC